MSRAIEVEDEGKGVCRALVLCREVPAATTDRIRAKTTALWFSFFEGNAITFLPPKGGTLN
jgi:hypothetical protein